MRTPSTFVITVVLVVGLVGCAPAPTQYNLTISATEGGEITTPDEETSGYNEGTVVPLVAFPHTGYRFVNWTGDVGTIADVNDAATTITVNGNYSITANFELEQEEEEAPTEVRLGATLPETGIFAGFGAQGFGMQKAVDDQNDLGGIYLSEWDVTAPVRLIIKDSEGDFAKVGPLSTDLVVTEKVHALLSPFEPCELHDPTSVVADQYGVPQIVAGGPFEPWYYGMRAAENWTYTWFSGFAIVTPSAPPRDVDGYTLVDTWFMFMDEVDAAANTNMIAGVFASDDADGRGWYSTFPPLMEAYGMTVVGVEDDVGLFPMDATDYTSIIQAWQAADVEIIWGTCPGAHFGTLLSQCYEQGFQPKICKVGRAAHFPVDVISWGTEPPLGWGVGTDVWWSPHYDVAEGFVGIGGRTTASLAEDWATEVGEPLNQFIGHGYMAVQVMLDAIERAGDVDGDAINDALAETNLNTIRGWVKFDPETHFSHMPLANGQWFYDPEAPEEEPFTLYIVASALDFIPAEADLIFPKPW